MLNQPTRLLIRALAVVLAVGQLTAQSNCTHAAVADLFPSDAVTTNNVGITSAISASGNHVVLGSTGHIHSGVQSGAAWVVSNPGAPNQSEAELVPNGAAVTMFFARSIAINAVGDVIVIGAPGNGTNAPLRSRVYVYRFNGSAWIEEWFSSSAPFTDLRGVSVAISATGDLIAAGAPFWSGPNDIPYHIGGVFVYRHQSSGWVQESLLRPAGAFSNETIGNAIAMSSDGSLIAMRSRASTAPINNGAVFLFQNNGSGWTEVARLQEPVAYSNGGFGISIAIDAVGHTVAIGNYSDSRLAYEQGAVSIFSKHTSGWAFDAALLPTYPTVGCLLGEPVAINASGDRVIAGARSHEFNGVHTGAVQVFERTNLGWSNGAVHYSTTPELSGGFGKSVAMNAAGTRWAIGENGSDQHGVDAGRVHIFESPCVTPEIYCTAKTNRLGCVPQIAWQGTPSASSSSGFTVTASNTRNQQYGTLFYGTHGRCSAPWKGGTLCVQPPMTRTPLQNAAGTPLPINDCTGTFSFDFNTWTASGLDAALFTGQHVFAQYYSRDPGSTSQVNLTDAVEFFLEP